MLKLLSFLLFCFIMFKIKFVHTQISEHKIQIKIDNKEESVYLTPKSIDFVNLFGSYHWFILLRLLFASASG